MTKFLRKNLPEYHLALEWRLEHLDNEKKVIEVSLTYVVWTEEMLEVVIIEMTFQFMFFFVMAAVKDFITKGSRVPAEVQKPTSGLQAATLICSFSSEALKSRAGGVHRHNFHERNGSAHSTWDIDPHCSHTFCPLDQEPCEQVQFYFSWTSCGVRPRSFIVGWTSSREQRRSRECSQITDVWLALSELTV